MFQVGGLLFPCLLTLFCDVWEIPIHHGLRTFDQLTMWLKTNETIWNLSLKMYPLHVWTNNQSLNKVSTFTPSNQFEWKMFFDVYSFHHSKPDKTKPTSYLKIKNQWILPLQTSPSLIFFMWSRVPSLVPFRTSAPITPIIKPRRLTPRFEACKRFMIYNANLSCWYPRKRM